MFKKNMWVTAAALCFVSMNSFAVRDSGVRSSAELTKYKLEERYAEDPNAFRAEVQKRTMSTSVSDHETPQNKKREQKKDQNGGQGRNGAHYGKRQDADVQPYIDAHRELSLYHWR